MKKRNRVLASVVAGTLLAGTAGLAMAATIDNSGPLNQITISEDLNCDVWYTGDSRPEFYGGTACATLAAADGVLYGPSNIPAGNNANPRTGWTPVSQVQGGSGTQADPYTITTVVEGGQLSITQLDTYVVGQNSYKTTMSVTNTSGEAVESVLYHAADCYLQDSDTGYGEYNSATGAITCRAPDAQGQHSSAGRIEEFVPLVAGSNYLYAHYAQIWSAVGSQLPLPDEVRNGDIVMDNGIGLSWTLNLAAGETKSVSMLTNFSPLGEVGLPSTLVPENDTIVEGDETVVTATITNPNLTQQTLSSLTITLPDVVEYVAGSSSGIGEPSVSPDGKTLTFSGQPTVNASGDLVFKFSVEGSEAGVGALTLNGATEGGAPVFSSTASITVEEGTPPEPVEIALTAPQVTQASCTDAGVEVPPTVELAANTRYVTYTLEGDVAAGNTVSVVATPARNGFLPESAAGWVINTERNVATMEIVLESVDCQAPIVTVAPEDPKITQATCTAGPKIVMPSTTGIVYSGLPEGLRAGDTFTLTATPAEGYALGAADGWVINEDGTASKAFTLDKAPTDCSSTLPTTGASPWTTAFGVLGSALVLGGSALLIARRKAIA